MNGITLLILTIVIGYFYNNRYPQPMKYKIYFGIGCTAFLIFLYFMNYQTSFVYKMGKNIKEINEKPLYQSIPDFNFETVKSDNIKVKLANRQNLRCLSCHNPIGLRDIDSYKLSYITPLQYGGQNDISNLKLMCPSCFQFRNF
tara:strand:- start:198 stop:629 length:432 start_codon:yes stop_codon:yes gene_type:complete